MFTPEELLEGHGEGNLMRLQSHRELEAAREKLMLLVERYEANLRDQVGN
jgi:hypothetical protein